MHVAPTGKHEGWLRVGRAPLRIEDVIELAEGRVRIALDPDPDYRAQLARGVAAVEKALAEGRAIYGVSTGVGASVDNAIPDSLRDLLPQNVVRFHGCGTGRILEENEAAAVVAARLASLARGYSGVRPRLLERLCDFLNLRLLPRIPEEGSVGASGDLTPLSYLAAALLGEREVSLGDELLSAEAAHTRAGLEPLALSARESLAIMNGTSVMAALGCLAFGRAQRLARWACALTAVACEAMRGNPAHFDARIFALKPHPGTQRAAAWVRADLARPAGAGPAEPARLQDRYSLRCAPHVIGVLLDALDFSRALLETELNGVNDNPLVDPASGDILHGGNFYGGHLCFALDGLKAAVASVADLLDRQLCLLCDPATSGGLPANLVAAPAGSVAHHGFKAMQITASALTAEALKLTMPASAFSRSTESHNQDKVSMGMIAARESLRVLDLTEKVAAVHTLALCQAVDLREGEADGLRSRALRDAVRKAVPINLADRRQDGDIAKVLAMHAAGELATGDLDPG
jgi:histidine ammonia-lyase